MIAPIRGEQHAKHVVADHAAGELFPDELSDRAIGGLARAANGVACRLQGGLV